MKKFLIPLLTAAVVVSMMLAGCVPGAAPPVTPPPVTPPPVTPPPVTPPPAAEYPKEIVIGADIPMSGPAAVLGAKLKAAIGMAVDDINASGGIKNLGGAKLRVVIADNAGLTDIAAAEAERLITSENIAVIMGCHPTELPVAIVAEKYRTPLYGTLSIDPVCSQGFKYIFHDFNLSEDDVDDVLQGMEVAFKDLEEKPKTIAALFCGVSKGYMDNFENLAKLAPEHGYEVISTDTTSIVQPTFVPQLMKIEAQKPDCLVILFDLIDSLTLYREMMERESYFPYGVWTFGGGLEDPVFYGQLPPEAYEYTFVQEDGDSWMHLRPWYAEFNEEYKARIGDPLQSWDTHSANIYCGVWTIKHVLEQTEWSSDLATFRDNIRDAFSKIDITPETCEKMTASDGSTFCPCFIKGIDRVKFDETGHNTYHHGQISQNINGDHCILYPESWYYPPDFEPVMPIPPWDER